MEIRYKVSEAEFVRAARLERKTSSRSSLKTTAFWIFIMFCLMLLYASIRPGRDQAAGSSLPSAQQQSKTNQGSLNPLTPGSVGLASSPSGLLARVGPFLVLAGVWILIVTGLVPLRLRYLYHKDPRMKGQFTVMVTKDSIHTENTAGTSSTCAWSVYDYWSEGKGVIVLIFHSGAYSILSLAGLSGPQGDELRGVLSAALPRR
jgi:hypothetical protein